jgi:hypothetical protein
MFPDHLVSEYDRVGPSEITVGNVQVRVAHPAGQNADHFLPVPRCRDVPFDKLQGSVRFGDDY